MTPVTGEDVEAFAAGELSDADAERVLAAVAASPELAAELDECLQFRAVAHALRGAATPIARARRRRWVPLGASAAVLVAAALALYLALPHRAAPADDLDARVVASLAPSRGVQPRLSWPLADRYRPYDAPRAAGAPAERISFELLARVEQRHDPRAGAALQILLGNRGAAAADLARAPATADAASDRAALALLDGDAERAVRETTAALALQPSHAQAQWNRALALDALGLDRAAAAQFDALAARGEPGWAGEARAHAAALADARKRGEAAWRAVTTAGPAMVGGGPPILDQIATCPGQTRFYFYDAVRAAPTAERVRALGPLADALDQYFGGGLLRAYVDRSAAAPFARRAALAPRYAALARGELAGAAAFLRDARAAHQDDMLLGALVAATPDHRVAPADLPEFERLAAASGDPWFGFIAAEQRGYAELDRGATAAAESALRARASQCTRAFDHRCARIWGLLTVAYLNLHRPAAATEALANARRAAAASGAIVIDDWLLSSASKIALMRDEIGGTGQAVVLAYLEEMQRRDLDCNSVRAVRDQAALALVNQHRLAEARLAVANAPACDVPPSLDHAFLLAQVVDRGDAAAVAALRAQLVALRADPTTGEGQRAIVDHLEGRILLQVAPTAARALLRRAIAAPLTDSFAVDARGYSYAVLVEDAGRRGAWSEVLALLAEERGAAVPARCALGAADDDASVMVVRGADGRDAGVYQASAVGGGERSDVPAPLRAALSGCELIDVFARHPYYGRADLLPTALPWRFRVGRAVSAAPAGGSVLVIANVAPPPALGLAPLNPVVAPPGAAMLERDAATPTAALAAMAGASFIEIHTHGLAGVGDHAALLVLSPDARGTYVLAAEDIARAPLRGRPVVILAACDASVIGRAFLPSLGLADAFIAAGASAVIASPAPIEDAAAPRFFAGVRARIAAGSAVVEALHAEREAWQDPTQREWIDNLIVFQ